MNNLIENLGYYDYAVWDYSIMIRMKTNISLYPVWKFNPETMEKVL